MTTQGVRAAAAIVLTDSSRNDSSPSTNTWILDFHRVVRRVFVHTLAVSKFPKTCSHMGSECVILIIRVLQHYNNDVIMSAMASQFRGVPILCSTVCSSEAQTKHQTSAPLAFVRGIHRWPVDFPSQRASFHLMTSSYISINLECREVMMTLSKYVAGLRLNLGCVNSIPCN